MTDRQQFIQGLRQFADWLAANPNLPLPQPQPFLVPLHTNQAVLQFAEHLDTEVYTDTEGNCRARITFGPFAYQAYGYTDFDATTERRAAANAQRYADTHNLTLTPKIQETAA